MQNWDAINAIIDESGAQSIEHIIHSLAQPAISIEAKKTEKSAIPIATSKFGGDPDVPLDFQWPYAGNFAHSFIAQFELGALQNFEAAKQLPSHGLLSFFYDCVNYPWGYDPADRHGWRVYNFGTNDLQRTPPPPPVDIGALEEAAPRSRFSRAITSLFTANLPRPPKLHRAQQFNVCRLSFNEWLTFPHWESLPVEALSLPRNELDLYIKFDCAIAEKASGSDHHLLGHPDPVQSDMQLECQLAANGLSAGNNKSERSIQGQALAPGANDWTLLFQCDYEENTGWNWGDLGRLYFWINKKDLERQHFNNVWTVLQCT